MKNSRFVHLHVHTEYSLLDGTIRLENLFKKISEYNMTSVAMTDHGNIFGAIDFYQKAKNYGIKPIIGCELYVAPNSRFDRNVQGISENSYHLIVLAKDFQGYKNLMKLSTLGYLDGFYYRPRVDKEILAKHNKGLIALSACLQGEICHHLLTGNVQKAKQTAVEYQDIFGNGNFFLEIMENGLQDQKVANEGLIKIAKELSIPLVATNDCHYVELEDAEAHELLLCIQTGKTLDHTDRMKFATNQFYLRSPDEMKQLFMYCQEAVNNTMYIADMCDLNIEFGHFYLPHFETTTGETLDEHFKDMAIKGLNKLMPVILKGSDDHSSKWKLYVQRLNEELQMIISMGFAGYFLIVADFVKYAKSRNIPVGPGRGSAAGSLVAYALGITNIDPIRYGLFFERFLNPDRITMPDIDIDFCHDGREEIIKYVTEKYGADRVAQIITFGKMQARAVIRDVGRAMNIPYSEVDSIAKLVSNSPNITLEKAIEKEPRLNAKQIKDDKIKKLISFSRLLEGLNRHSSTHAAGVVISDLPLVERVPLCKSQKDEVVTQFSMKDLEMIGLIKFDFLGLKTLTVINNALKYIKESRGFEIDINSIPLDDQKTYELLTKGNTDGVFQLESSGMKDILVNMKPDCIEDIMTLIALYRPGPMNMVPEFISRKQGKTKITYELPELEKILKETYGVIVYQEQVMQIASEVADYTMAQADILRKVMSKKNPSEMEKERPKFMEGMKKKKIPEKIAKKIWEQMETFAQYGFNKSHSAAYAMISYQTAYLKANYPVEFMAALLTSEKDNRDKIIKYIGSCKEIGIKVLPPDINESMRDFSISGENIRFGLAAVKHVGVGAVDAIISAREKRKRFQTFADFCCSVDLKKINKRMIESLIKCGAFDSMGYKRRYLMASYESIIDSSIKRFKESESDQISLFDSEREAMVFWGMNIQERNPDIAEWDQRELLANEKDALGFYITGNPLLKYANKLANITNVDSHSIQEQKDNDAVVIAGIVSTIREINTKKKKIMAHVTIEDLKGSITAIFFPDIYLKYSSVVQGIDPIIIKGYVEAGEEGVKLIASEAYSIDREIEKYHSHICFFIDGNKTSADVINRLKSLIQKEKYKGFCSVYLHILINSCEVIVFLGNDVKLEPSYELKCEADTILGPGATVF